jgi:hypothetical protein
MIFDIVLLNLLRRNEYVPKVPSCNSALLVALLLNHVPGTPGLTKEKLMVLAEETGVAGSESMSGDGGYYNGWSGMSQMLLGDPALVRKEKGSRFSLTTQVITPPIPFTYFPLSPLLTARYFAPDFIRISRQRRVDGLLQTLFIFSLTGRVFALVQIHLRSDGFFITWHAFHDYKYFASVVD